MRDINILIVEDNLESRILLKRVCGKFSAVSVYEAENGLSGVRIAEETRPDIVLMDYMMPEMDGLQATKRICSLYTDAAVIVITADTTEETEARLLDAGAITYLNKPVRVAKVSNIIKNFIELIRNREEGDLPKESEFESLKKRLFRIKSHEGLVSFTTFLSKVFHESGLKKGRSFLSVFNLLYDYFDRIISADMSVEAAVLYDERNLVVILPDVAESFSKLTSSAFYSLVKDNVERVGDDVRITVTREHEESLPPVEPVAPSEEKVDKTEEHVQEEEPVQEEPPVYEEPKPDAEFVSNKSAFDDTLEESRAKLLRRTHTTAKSAAEYVASLPEEVLLDIEVLEEQSDALYTAIYNFEGSSSREELGNIINVLLSYSKVINYLKEFAGIGLSLADLASFLDSLNPDELSADDKSKLVLLLFELESDIAAWRTNIFIDREARDIHYLDSSLYSTSLQLQMVFGGGSGGDEDDIEFF
ncbi:response regulator [Limisalsivibrio acetivorans]|uniref:response regulator n=1 Tax=Limisalsivibrio acetivorans TaxID=1304888 RepID=UPI00138AC667|nr:response regulator [Limisalsivibrio acetivorans]